MFNVVLGFFLRLQNENRHSLFQIDFAFHQWRAFPDQLVGFTLRDHYWDPILNSWMFTSRISNSYSMVMLNAAVFHRYTLFL